MIKRSLIVFSIFVLVTGLCFSTNLKPDQKDIASFETKQIDSLEKGGILYSRIGYNLNSQKRILIRGLSKEYISNRATFSIVDLSGNEVFNGPIKYWGKKWKSSWWTIDFTDLIKKGKYSCKILNNKNASLETGTFEIQKDLLWNKTWKTVSLTQLDGRIELRNQNLENLGPEFAQGGGWQDCGNYLREVNSRLNACRLIGCAGI
ncbi:N-terminal ig-like domain of cellulase [Arenibacter nanhaiticus]|uniref:N-terminal ig-like domain of cellulase n=2 Tax=Arenibacter nanhaiticus TaxID=558155 RepID=A0A1M6C7A4_9FLAO|nr:N-terminal ig-like domain of cellulase [Arenibacter nanhaiticus]